MPTPQRPANSKIPANQGAQAGIDQIREKGYADKFTGHGKKIIHMGINFDTGKRNVSEWKIV